MAEVLAGLRAKALFGLYWTGGLHLLGQIVTWAITLVVIACSRRRTTACLRWRRYSSASCD